MTTNAERLHIECTRTLYRQIPNSFVAAMGVTLYMVVTMWRNAPGASIAWWLGIQGIAQVHRFWILRRYRRAVVTQENSHYWSRQYAIYMTLAGCVWGLCPFLFFLPASPLSQVFTMCGLYGIAGGAVSGNAYYPAALRNFVVAIFGAVMLRMLMMNGPEYLVLGVASLFYMLILLAFCKVQHQSIVESFRIRFENEALVEQLRIEKATAEQAQRRAEQADHAKSRFLAAASHDLRQPLHALGLFSATLRELRLDQRQQAAVEQIYRNIDALEALFDELLDISKLDAGYVRPQLAHVPLQRVLDSLHTHYAVLAEDKGVRLEMRGCDGVVHTDAALLERVLGNLLANAIRYTQRGGVLVGCRRRGGGWQIEVWDTGIGIEPDQRARIFEEFYQVGNPERDRRKGLGLGLAIAQRTAQLLGGAIEVDSAPGRGSVFRLRVPAGDAAAARVLPDDLPVAGADMLAGRAVVVVDDEVSIRHGMGALLSQWGCDAIVAGTTGEVLAGWGQRATAPDLIIADYRLGGEATGIEVVGQLRARFGRAIPAMLITGDVSPERLRTAQGSGLHVLHKPVRPAQLRALCNFLLTQPAEDAPQAGS